ncbi:Uncharacterised protein [Mycobacteroides abscessus subsp. abscessus]|nr:Uncharacterised protein [Mycobacteroides abscessus subsp. abscessus]
MDRSKCNHRPYPCTAILKISRIKLDLPATLQVAKRLPIAGSVANKYRAKVRYVKEIANELWVTQRYADLQQLLERLTVT